LNLDDSVHIPAVVTFGFVEQEAVLLNKQTNQYFMLDEVGARLWALLKDGKSAHDSYHILLDEYEVDPIQLECDLRELLDDLEKHGLVEIIRK
jgi:hypothetical protein